MPEQYVKIRNIEKKIFFYHKSYKDLNELESKDSYVNLARSLKTYGATLFLVKEKLKNRNKLIPRILGITKDAVLKIDEKSKIILNTWPLTIIRRWNASSNTFTLDFGDYSDSYYSVKTTESEKIHQLISGYIDIILSKKKINDYLGVDLDERSVMIEENIQPSQ